jgi:hypothetical protein
LAETLGDRHRTKMPHGPFWNRFNMVGQVLLAFALILLLLRIIGWIAPNSFANNVFHYLYETIPFINYKWFVDLLWAGSTCSKSWKPRIARARPPVASSSQQPANNPQPFPARSHPMNWMGEVNWLAARKSASEVGCDRSARRECFACVRDGRPSGPSLPALPRHLCGARTEQHLP